MARVAFAPKSANTSTTTALPDFMTTLFDVLVDGIITIDASGIIQFVNVAAQAMFGYTPAELLGRNISVLMPEPYRSRHDQYLADYRQGSRMRIIGVGGRELPMQRKDGSIFAAELAVGEAPGDTNHVFVGTIRDLSERKEAERTQELLRQSQKMEALGQLTGGIAHDFNNLLSIIVGHLDILTEKLSDAPDMQRHVDPCIEAALRGSALTQQLLAFGRRQALQPKTLSVNPLLVRSVALLRRTLGERIDIVTTLADDLHLTHIDPNQLENAIVNLAVNARDAMPEGGKLIIETRNVDLDEDYASRHVEVDPGCYVMIAISDTGHGMTADVCARVFEPFFTTKPLGRGTGLGLSMVHGFIKQSRGHVSIYSEVGRGTCIRLYLPCVHDRASVAEPATTNPQPPSARGERVLVVEDNDAVLTLSTLMIRGLGYEPVSAGSGEQALQLLHAHPDIAIMFSDVMLAGDINGPQLAQQAMMLRPDLKILFTSGYAEAAIAESGILGSGIPLLSKPFRKVDLAAKLAALATPSG